MCVLFIHIPPLSLFAQPCQHAKKMRPGMTTTTTMSVGRGVKPTARNHRNSGYIKNSRAGQAFSVFISTQHTTATLFQLHEWTTLKTMFTPSYISHMLTRINMNPILPDSLSCFPYYYAGLCTCPMFLFSVSIETGCNTARRNIRMTTWETFKCTEHHQIPEKWTTGLMKWLLLRFHMHKKPTCPPPSH